MTITLINRTGRMKIYNLPHRTYCKALGKCACTKLPGRNAGQVCASLTLASGVEVDGVPETVLQVKEIAKDISSGGLRVKRTRAATGSQPPVSKLETKRLRKKKKQSKTAQ